MIHHVNRFLQILKGFLIVGGCFVAAVYTMFEPFFSTPSLEQCRTVTGMMQRSDGSEMMQGKWVGCRIFNLPERAEGAKYLYWFPHYGDLDRLLRPDIPVTIWASDGKKNWIWQIEQDGLILVSHEEIYASCWEYGKSDRRIGATLLSVLTVGAAIFFFKCILPR